MSTASRMHFIKKNILFSEERLVEGHNKPYHRGILERAMREFLELPGILIEDVIELHMELGSVEGEISLKRLIDNLHLEDNREAGPVAYSQFNNQSINQSINSTINQSINQSISQFNNQSVNQSVNQSIIHHDERKTLHLDCSNHCHCNCRVSPVWF